MRMTPCLLADFTVLDVKLIVAHRSMVDSPCLHVAVHKSIAKWALVNKTKGTILSANDLSLSTGPPPIGGSAAPGR